MYFFYRRKTINNVLLKFLGPACRNRWVSLRDQFRKTKRIAKSAENTRKWKHANRMAFLRSFINDKQSVTNFYNQSDTESVTRQQSFTYVKSETGDQIVIPERESQRSEHTVTSSSMQIENQKFSDDDISKTYSSSKNTSKKVSSSTLLLNYIIEKNKNTIDPIDVFFNGVCATVKQMSPYYQNIAKSKIFSIVTDIEMKQIMEANGTLKESSSDKVTKHQPQPPPEVPLNIKKYKSNSNNQPPKKVSALNINIPSSLYNLQSGLSYEELTDDLSACFHTSAPSPTMLQNIKY